MLCSHNQFCCQNCLTNPQDLIQVTNHHPQKIYLFRLFGALVSIFRLNDPSVEHFAFTFMLMDVSPQDCVVCFCFSIFSTAFTHLVTFFYCCFLLKKHFRFPWSTSVGLQLFINLSFENWKGNILHGGRGDDVPILVVLPRGRSTRWHHVDSMASPVGLREAL